MLAQAAQDPAFFFLDFQRWQENAKIMLYKHENKTSQIVFLFLQTPVKSRPSRCFSSAGSNTSALKTLNLQVSSESWEFIRLAVAAESLKPSRGGALTHRWHLPSTLQHGRRWQFFEVFTANTLILLLQLLDVSQKEKKKKPSPSSLGAH